MYKLKLISTDDYRFILLLKNIMCSCDVVIVEMNLRQIKYPLWLDNARTDGIDFVDGEREGFNIYFEF